MEFSFRSLFLKYLKKTVLNAQNFSKITLNDPILQTSILFMTLTTRYQNSIRLKVSKSVENVIAGEKFTLGLTP